MDTWGMHEIASMIHQLDALPNLPAGLFARCGIHGQGIAALRPFGEGYAVITAALLEEEVRLRARGLLRLGVKPGQRVLLMAPNSVDWAIMDFAILAVGAVTVPAYPSYGPADIRHVLRDSGSDFCLLESPAELARLGSRGGWGVAAEHVFLREAGADLRPWSALAELGRGVADVDLDRRVAQIRRQDMATLVYTSGTTGEPKGVVLSHGNILSDIAGFLPCVPSLESGQRVLSFLPLSHVFERVVDHFGPYLLGLEVAYGERPDTVLRDLRRARPHLLIAVPRVFQLLYHRLQREIEGRPGLLATLLRRELDFRAGDPPTWRNRLASRLVASRLRRQLGGRLQFFVSGGAPLPQEISRFFLGLGLPILEGYGMTEATAVIAANPLTAIRPGSVGKILPKLQCRIAPDGEILVQGPAVMERYWNNERASREVLADGWLHTGDSGFLDADGYLTIVDRKKDLIVNAAGENISPQKIETRLTMHPLIGQAVVFGDRLPYLVALIYANPEYAQKLLGGSYGRDALVKATHTAIQEALDGLPSYEQVRRFSLLEQPLGQETGELTPTFKVKRRVVRERYAKILEGLSQ